MQVYLSVLVFMASFYDFEKISFQTLGVNATPKYLSITTMFYFFVINFER